MRQSPPGGRPPSERVPRDRPPWDRAPRDRPPPLRTPDPALRRRLAERRNPRTFGRALVATAAATVAPGTGHLILHRVRTGALILATFLACVLAVVGAVVLMPRSSLLQNLLSTRVLVVAVVACLAAGVAWIAVIVRTYLLARPRDLPLTQQVLGAAVVTVLCLLIAAPLGFGANLANSQRNLLNTLFPSGTGGTTADGISKPRLNILLLGSDAGPDRTGTRTDTMMVASIDTRTGRTILFGLPRNIGFAQFPPGSPMAEEFPKGFHDPSDPASGNYLLNAVYAYGHEYPALAPAGPTADPGLNLLQSSISYMLGLPIDNYLEVNMAGFAAIIDALGGLRVDVGPERIPIGGISPTGRPIRPLGYIEPGLQQLTGEQALAFARSRTNSTDYVRMGRQRCLIQYVLDQKSPTDLLTNFQAVARATTDSVSTNIPQDLLPALVALAGESTNGVPLESVAFDPNLPDPNEPDGRFDTGDPDFAYMREVVRTTIDRDPAATPPTTAAAPSTTRSPSGSATPTPTSAPPIAPTSLAQAC